MNTTTTFTHTAAGVVTVDVAEGTVSVDIVRARVGNVAVVVEPAGRYVGVSFSYDDDSYFICEGVHPALVWPRSAGIECALGNAARLALAKA